MAALTLDASIAERVAAGGREIQFPAVFPPAGPFADPIAGGVGIPQIALHPNEVAVPHDEALHNPGAPGHFDAGLAAYRPKIIAVWNNKGGVAKTTITHALAFALAQDVNNRVLMVDADGQQNLMQMTLRRSVDNQQGNDAGDYSAYIKGLLPGSHACSSLEEATRAYRDSTGMQPLGIPYAFPVQDGPGSTINKRLRIVLAGDNFEKLEMEMSKCATSGHAGQQTTNNLAAPLPGMVWHAIWRAGRRVNANIIILDLAPALSALNQSLLMHCDYWITPCLPEQFSQKALERVTLQFGKWYVEFVGRTAGMSIRGASRGFQGTGPQSPAPYPLPAMRPQFAGCIISGYNASPTNKRTIIKPGEPLAVESPNGLAQQRLSAYIILRSQQLAAALTPPLQNQQPLPYQATQNTFAVPANLFPHAAGTNFYPQPHVLARIRKAPSGFESATTLFGKPFAFLTEQELGADTSQGRNLPNDAATRETIAHFQRIFMDLANFLMSLPTLTDDANGNFNFNMPPTQDAVDAGDAPPYAAGDASGRFR